MEWAKNDEGCNGENTEVVLIKQEPNDVPGENGSTHCDAADSSYPLNQDGSYESDSISQQLVYIKEVAAECTSHPADEENVEALTDAFSITDGSRTGGTIIEEPEANGDGWIDNDMVAPGREESRLGLRRSSRASYSPVPAPAQPATSPKPRGPKAKRQPAGPRGRQGPKLTFPWTWAQEEDLIDWWQENECLYNVYSAGFSNRQLKDKLLAAKAKEIGGGCTTEDVVTRIRSLRTKFNHILNQGRSGCGKPKTSRERWVLERLHFVRPFMSHRKTKFSSKYTKGSSGDDSPSGGSDVNMGAEPVRGSHGNMGAGLLPISHGSMRTELPVSHGNMGAEPLPISHGNMRADLLPVSHSNLGAEPLPVSHSNIGAELLRGSHSNMGAELLRGSHGNMGAELLRGSHGNMGAEALRGSHGNLEAEQLPGSATDGAFGSASRLQSSSTPFQTKLKYTFKSRGKTRGGKRYIPAKRTRMNMGSQERDLLPQLAPPEPDNVSVPPKQHLPVPSADDEEVDAFLGHLRCTMRRMPAELRMDLQGDILAMVYARHREHMHSCRSPGSRPVPGGAPPVYYTQPPRAVSSSLQTSVHRRRQRLQATASRPPQAGTTVQ